jgi:hypothetical protein
VSAVGIARHLFADGRIGDGALFQIGTVQAPER